MLDTTAKTGEEFLQAERLRHRYPGKNVEIAFTQFKKLCTIRGCPNFSEDELIYMDEVVSMAKCDSTQAERSRPVDENKRQKDRNIITAAEVQKLLRVCADMPDRLTAARADSCSSQSTLIGQHPDRRVICAALGATLCSMTLLARCPVALA